MPIAWKGKVAQYAGRLHRNFKGKNEVQIFDYVDIRVSVLERMYQKRLKAYSSIGYHAKIPESSINSQGIIYDGRNFLSAYYSNLNGAMHEITIVSPFIRKNRIIQFEKVLSPLIENGVSVTIVTRPPEDFKETDRQSVCDNISLLEKIGVSVKLKSDFHQMFTIIDNAIIWYGSVNFLSFSSHKESVIRFESTDLAAELLDTVDK